jgi:hypothetical protein
MLQHVLVAAYGVGLEFVLLHVASITKAVLRELDIQQIEWPAVSPDLNPIEYCGIGLTEVFVGALFRHRLSKT